MTRIRTRPARAALAAATVASCLLLAAGVLAPASLAATARSGTVAAPAARAAAAVTIPAPVHHGALPPQLAALNRTFLNVVELTVRAALDGSRDHVYQAALLDPNAAATLTTAQTVALCDELLDAHRHLLPAALLR